MSKEAPSLDIKHERPHGWIQWKGTNVCMDIHCSCGESTHIDAEFLYHVKCGACGRVYECDGHITLHPLDFEPDNVKVSD
jgi:hypothetical protein